MGDYTQKWTKEKGVLCKNGLLLGLFKETRSRLVKESFIVFPFDRPIQKW